jgi:transposase
MDYHPASLFIQEIERPTYICRHCEHAGHDIQAAQQPLPPAPLPRFTVGAGFLAYVFVSKWIDHLPLYRQEGILERLGCAVARTTLCDQMMACANLLTPFYELLRRRVLRSAAIHADDSTVVLLDPRRTAYAWDYVGDQANPYTVLELTVGRQHEYPEKFLAGYRGFVHADGYTGYNAVYAAGATHVGCWMHVRRYFFEAKGNDPKLAHEAIARIRLLYAVESDAKHKHLSGADLAAYRQEQAGPIVQAFGDWLAQEVPRALPKSKIGEALTYAANQWPTLGRYVHDGRLTIDNGPAEQTFRALALGRKNWLHIAGDGGLHSAAVLLSVAASAKRHGVNPWLYFKDLLTEVAARPADAELSDLLPDVWKARQPTTGASGT